MEGEGRIQLRNMAHDHIPKTANSLIKAAGEWNPPKGWSWTWRSPSMAPPSIAPPTKPPKVYPNDRPLITSIQSIKGELASYQIRGVCIADKSRLTMQKQRPIARREQNLIWA